MISHRLLGELHVKTYTQLKKNQPHNPQTFMWRKTVNKLWELIFLPSGQRYRNTTMAGKHGRGTSAQQNRSIFPMEEPQQQKLWVFPHFKRFISSFGAPLLALSLSWGSFHRALKLHATSSSSPSLTPTADGHLGRLSCHAALAGCSAFGSRTQRI